MKLGDNTYKQLIYNLAIIPCCAIRTKPAIDITKTNNAKRSNLQLVTSYGESAAAYDFRYVSKEYRVDVPPFAYEASYTRRAGGDAASRAR